ncbi:Plasmodium exported protein (PHISTc), unknown function [Plasmodium sp. gorilla clade G2]|uniref:Plasmodium exported protein (PHISTc), unknown function n=1 Tax=Plasmodium sp. gorilla clade G2 TaxID=880535 RepID=UPI000D2651B9|nr:Plasmodium exported protein (PHISTc), unknown function [Plasmodium sp. gorilla clade G2]SOV20051.1 Plasmodium exported protein (PHISTc), unknown function [Plasmodium sp. gorilla clade G2]
MKQRMTFKKFMMSTLVVSTITLMYFVLLLKTCKIQYSTKPNEELLHRNSRTLASAMHHSFRGDYLTQRCPCAQREKQRKQKVQNLIENENNAEDYFNNLKFDLQYTEELNTQITTLDPKNSVEELKNIFYDLNENRRKKFHYLIEALENVTIILAYQNEIPEKKRMATWCKIKCDLQSDFIKENPNIDSNFEAFITKIQSIDEFISYLKECIHSWNKFTNEKKTQYFPKVYETFQSDQKSKENKLNKLNNKTECNPKQSMKTEYEPKKSMKTEYEQKKSMKTECTPKECTKTECNSNKNDKKVNSTEKNNKNKTNQKCCNKK